MQSNNQIQMPNGTKPTSFEKATSASAIIFALITLFNPNINIIDLIPDFIGYFILAFTFEKAADCAPYFEEARSAFVKLGFVSLLKIPALFIIVFARSKNTLDNDIIVLMTCIFAIAECIILIKAIKNIFDALSYLGQRTDAASLINNDKGIDELRILSYVFLIGKNVLAFLPETLRLTKSVEVGSVEYYVTGSKFYAPALIAALLFSLILGIVWLVKMRRFVRAVKSEGRFDASLLSLASESAPDEYNRRKELRSVYNSFLFFMLGAICTFRLHFDNYYDVNLIPPTLVAVFFLLGIIKLSRHIPDFKKLKIASVTICAALAVASTAAYIVNTRFLIEYGYSQLLMNSNDSAVSLYKTYILISIAELILFLGVFVCYTLLMRGYFLRSPIFARGKSDSFRQDKEYCGQLIKKTVILAVTGAFTAITKFIDICLHSRVQLIFSNPDDITMPTIIAPTLPWFNIVVVLSSVIFVLYSFYYYGFVKEEMKYQSR